MYSSRPILSVACLAVLFAAASPLAAQSLQDSSALPRGTVIPVVPCAAKPEQSYALYLPSAYTSARRWPIIFAFDPGARGRVPVELFRDAAEKYGYIVAGSNNSRNGPYALQIEAADAMMQDVSRRFSLDEKRFYTTGFSGGARVATMVAQLCNGCVAGVIAHGAGFPESRVPDKRPSFVYFAAVGDLDFNYYELVELMPKLDTLVVPNRLRRFSGPHQWAPPEVCMEAVEWLELMAMKQGRRERNVVFVAQQLDRATQFVRQLEKSGDLYAAWREYRKLVEDFTGLADTSFFARRAAELESSAPVREGEKRERAAIEEQARIVAPIAAELNTLTSDLLERAQARSRLAAQIADLRERIKKNTQGEKAKALRRAQTELFVHALEAGEEKLRARDFSLAVAFFEIAAELVPDSPRPFLQIARAHAQAGKPKETLRALQQALAKGFPKDALAAFLRETPEFAPFLSSPDFQQLLQSR